MSNIKEIPASNWTGTNITIELLSDLSFKLYDYTFTLIKVEEEYETPFGGAAFEITGDAWESALGRVYRFKDGECIANVSGIERCADDIITAAAQVLANTI